MLEMLLPPRGTAQTWKVYCACEDTELAVTTAIGEHCTAFSGDPRCWTRDLALLEKMLLLLVPLLVPLLSV